MVPPIPKQFESKLADLNAMANVLEGHKEDLSTKIIDSSRLVKKFAEYDVKSLIRIFRDYDKLLVHLQNVGVDFSQRIGKGKVGVILPYNGPAMCFGLSFAGAYIFDMDIEIKGASESRPFFSMLERIFNNSVLSYVLKNSDGTPLFSQESGTTFLHRHLEPASRTSVLEIYGHDSYIDDTVVAALERKQNPFSLILEGPGKNRFIVEYPISNLEDAARTMVDLKSINSGQTCMNAETFDVHEEVLPDLLPLLEESAASKVINDPYFSDADIGPLKNRIASRIKEQVHDALRKGAEVAFVSPSVRSHRFYPIGEMKSWQGQFLDYSIHPYQFVPLTILTGLSADAKLRKEETFGPVIGIRTFSDDRLLIDEIENQKYGLGATIYGDNLSTEHKDLVGALYRNTGHVFENAFMFAPGQFDVLLSPWGGYKNSRFSLEARPVPDGSAVVTRKETGPQYIVLDFSEVRFDV